MGMFESWGNTLKDLASSLFGKAPKVETKGLLPGDRGYMQAVFGVTIDEKKSRPGKRPPVASSCKRYDQIQRRRKLARKGPRWKKRLRQAGPYAREAL